MDFRFEDDRLDASYDVWRELASEPVPARAEGLGRGSTPRPLDPVVAAPLAAPKIEAAARKPSVFTRALRVLFAISLAPIPSVALVSLMAAASRGA